MQQAGQQQAFPGAAANPPGVISQPKFQLPNQFQNQNRLIQQQQSETQQGDNKRQWSIFKDCLWDLDNTYY